MRNYDNDIPISDIIEFGKRYSPGSSPIVAIVRCSGTCSRVATSVLAGATPH